MKTVNVVGAVIKNKDGKILCALRSPVMSMPNLWEFPGGKIREGEDPADALVREIQEELGCTICVGKLIEEVSHQYPAILVNLATYEAEIIEGEPKPLEHEKLAWVKSADLMQLEWAPADVPTVERLRDFS
ncbi:(deoxy)nucleoside triphosphate pyrophosphohydrolase [Anaerobacillus sp. CMMVII]|uniref:(deoxy)nucleoside triphosphate pyrophosphohydrolase n=1 Tax=Anaerobacillus sp. CMMVII TaxID=2755588 RepID=UPI0021B7463F|nr:(deoxy)nucleoside triphosphate pyrophosphohydrolase [Anaerobacillus sp. CMMVII]MCT8140037.1 (deoxy)nucleoside triphosphate pyrophosphohydrolase [Anaerobacillus sp. CMMVII]